MSTTPDQTESPQTPPSDDPLLDPEPTVSPSSTPDGPQTIPAAPSPPGQGQPGPGQPGQGQAGQGSDGAVHGRTQTEQANEEMQAENAGTALDQPSDGSGGE